MKQFIKYLILLIIGGTIYYSLELLTRGYSHWSMFLLGGICFISLGLINKFLSWETPLWKQGFIGGFIVTTLEFITGCIVNLYLGWNVWHYTKLDLFGQISLLFFFIWCGLSIVGIVLDDWLRYWLFKEERPRYKLK